MGNSAKVRSIRRGQFGSAFEREGAFGPVDAVPGGEMPGVVPGGDSHPMESRVAIDCEFSAGDCPPQAVRSGS
jgi:hypothetical protein